MANDKIKHGRSKHISNYGGVGSIIETTECSIIIETFDNWGYGDLNEKLAQFIIKDDRLLIRLRSRFPNLKHLVSIPEFKSYKFNSPPIVQPKANYFPKWFYCNNCNRLADYSEWRERWRSSGKNLPFFNPPKCNNKECREATLEQIRFVMTCPNGHIDDIPWQYWNNRLPTDKTSEDEEEGDDEMGQNRKPNGPQLNFSKCCPEQSLSYRISRENTELSGIWIECSKCKKK